MVSARQSGRKLRAKAIVAYLKKAYPTPASELSHQTPFQFVVAVILSAQCTDKAVNKLTETLFKKYKTPKDFAEADPTTFTKEVSSIPFFRTKAKNIIAAAQEIQARHSGAVPRTASELVALPGIGYKAAPVVRGARFGGGEGIGPGPHGKRFALKFDLTDATDPTKISKDLEMLIPKKDWKYVNNGLVLYGRYVCPARPHDCTDHPLTKLWPPAALRWPKAK